MKMVLYQDHVHMIDMIIISLILEQLTIVKTILAPGIFFKPLSRQI